MNNRFDAITPEYPYMIRNFGNDTLCENIEHLRSTLVSSYIDKDVTIHAKSGKSQLVSTYYISIDINGNITNTYGTEDTFNFKKLEALHESFIN